LMLLLDGVNEVTAECRLFVRLVTDEMLSDSVTIRLDNIDLDAFLSPLYHLFVSAVAGVVPSAVDSVFVIGVLDDTEVLGRRVVNVTLAVRRLVDRSGRDVFHSARSLREKIYLQRELLAKLSTLEVSTITLLRVCQLYLSKLWYTRLTIDRICILYSVYAIQSTKLPFALFFSLFSGAFFTAIFVVYHSL